MYSVHSAVDAVFLRRFMTNPRLLALRNSAVVLIQFSRRPLVFLAALLLIAVAAFRPTAALAQNPMDFLDQGNGIPNNTTEFKVPLGFINLTNGNLHQEIVFGSFQQRAHTPPVVLKAVYDSRFWQFPPDGSSWWPSFMGKGGWRIVTTADAGLVTYDQQPFPCNDQTADTQMLNFRYIDSEGYTHMFWESSGRGSVNTTVGPNCADNHPDSGYAMDGSGYFIQVTNTVSNGNTYTNAVVYGPDGNQVYPAMEDSNGNFFSYLGAQGSPTTDTLGRTPYTVTTCSDNPNATCYNVPNSSGGTSTYEVTFETFDVCTAFNKWGDDYCSSPGGHPSFKMIQSIVLPDKTSYTFKYDSGTTPGNYGELTDVTLPTGATLHYSYGTFADVATGYSDFSPNRWITGYSTGEGSWTLQPQAVGASTAGCPCNQVTITKPSNDQEVYTFWGGAPTNPADYFYNGTWNTKVQYYNGAATGDPIMTTETDYTHPGDDPFPASITVSLARPGGTLYKKTTYTWKQNGSGVMNAPKTINEYGYGLLQTGPLLRTTKYTYLDEVNSTYANANITNKPVNKSEFDGNGVQVAQTVYEYDNYTEGITGGGNVQHDPNFGTGFTVRGNLTATQVWRNTDGAYITTVRNQYDDSGEITKTTDANGNSTKYNYLDAWNDATCKPAFQPGIGGNAGAFPTTTTDALEHVSKATYNSCTGTLASSTDPNNQTTTYSYEPLFDRLQRKLLPPTLLNGTLTQGGAWIDYTSAAASAPAQQDTYTALTQSPASGCAGCAHQQVQFDGLGREVVSSLVNDPDGQVFTRTKYDSSGRVLRVSNPYRGSDNGGEVYAYDGLDRKVSTTYPDGSVSHTYYGPDIVNVAGSVGGQSSSTDLASPTVFADEAGMVRETWTDAFGRLVEVDEPGAASNGSASSGSLTINGSLLSQSGVGATGGTPAAGSITIGGTEQRILISPGHQVCLPHVGCTYYPPVYAYDSGTLTLNENGHICKATFGQGDNVSVIAGKLQVAIGANCPDLNVGSISTNFTTNPPTATIPVSDKNAGSAGNNIALSSSVSSQYNSFTIGTAGLSGGADGTPGTTVTDSGTVTLSGPGGSLQTCYAPTASASCPAAGNFSAINSPEAIAFVLANKINVPGAGATATVSGTTISITYKQPGALGNGPLTLTSASNNPSLFPQGSFSGSGTLAGGSDPYPAGLQHPYITLYAYDTLGNLLCVEQHGDASSGTGCSSYPSPTANDPWRTRMFSYNSLSDLLTAYNPETGAMRYSYDDNGNLKSKAAPAPNQTGSATVTTTYGYDPLNRITAKSYSDNTTPAANFIYDTAIGWGNPSLTQTNIIGRLTEAYAAAGGSVFSYDSVGRIVMNNQSTPLIYGNANWPVSYNYDLDGNLTSYTPGAGVTFRQSLDAVGRITQIASSMADAQHPGTLAVVDTKGGYSPAGDILKLALGNGLTETAVYNSRLQPCRTNVNSSGTTLLQCGDNVPGGNVQDFSYNFGTANATDNGNLISISAVGARNFKRNYSYDVLNRLQSMSAAGDPCDGMSWSYDAWGNRTSQSGPCFASQVTVNAQNRLNPPYLYDSAGNLTFDGVNTYFYDAENRVVQVNGTLGNCSTATACYSYDALGRRIGKTIGSVKTDYIYDLSSHVVTEENNICASQCLSASYIYLDDKLVAEYKDSTTYFVHKDQLGSARLVTKVDGSIFASLDYLPFGEQTGGSTVTTHKFTGKERDGETGNDYFGARYYASTLGRFTIADWSKNPVPVPFAKMSNPQSMNLYAYMENNPTSGVDADGHGDPTQSGTNSTGPDCGGSQTCVVNPENPQNEPQFVIKKTVHDHQQPAPNYVLIPLGTQHPPVVTPGPKATPTPTPTPQPRPVPPPTLEEFCKAYPDVCNSSTRNQAKPLPHSFRRNRTWWETFKCSMECGAAEGFFDVFRGAADSWNSCESAGQCAGGDSDPHDEVPLPDGRRPRIVEQHPAEEKQEYVPPY